MRLWLIPVAVSISILAVAACLCGVLLSAQADLALIPRFLADIQRASLLRLDRLQATVDRLPQQIIPPVIEVSQEMGVHATDSTLAVVKDSLRTADARLASIQDQVDRTSKEILGVASTQLGRVNDTVAGLRADLKPTMDETRATIAEVHSFVDDNYLDASAAVASATVAVAGIGRASDEIAKAAPKMTASALAISSSASGIVADAHAWTDKYVQPHPMKFIDYVKSASKTVLGLGTAALRGGVF